jgi:3-carboxy-cis,cis-muconate cycloisomerase
LVSPLFRWDALEEVFSDRARLQSMLDFEAALARAEAATGVIPAAVAPAIAAKCAAELFDGAAITRSAAQAGNLAIPLVKALTTLVADADADAGRYVHWGATSQDAIDTALVLQLRRAVPCIESELARLADALAALAEEHRGTVVAGRTWMQQAVPTSLGVKIAGWLDAVNRHRTRFAEVRERALVLQFGGAVGTLAALGNRGMDVAAALARELQLPPPDLPWHSHRDRLAEVATTVGLCTGTLGKIARDISLHMQTEIAEIAEPTAEGRGGSSTMPHKRNPLASAVALAAATRIPGLVGSMLSGMVQEQERGLGGWHAEWETVPELMGLFGGALHHLTEAVIGLEIDALRMSANLEATQGLIFAEAVQMALAGTVGRVEAQRLVEAACQRARSERKHLRDVLAAHPATAKHLPPAELARLFDPRQYLGAAPQMIDRVLAAHALRRAKPREGG